jgi:AcrR family transcriptional regulator
LGGQVTRTTAGRPQRADARRNQQRILAAAEAVFAEQGTDGSLEEIARRAEVGSATLHRHFPSRRALLLALFEDGIITLCDQARTLAQDAEPGPGLTTWLHALLGYTVTHRGLSLSLLLPGLTQGTEAEEDPCHTMLTEAATPLLQSAQQAGAVRPDVTLTDLLTLVTAIATATEAAGDPDGAERLLSLALNGINA